MNDPYSVLGVSPNTSDEELKKIYKELVRKFHPDNYHDSPLADWAQNKMKEINEAYDEITKMRSGQGGNGRRASYGPQTNAGGTGVFAQVRAAINRGDLAQAEHLLGTISDRGAEWNFLMGSVYYRKGWLDEARRYFQTACSMDPSNGEYRQALSYMDSAGAAYRPPQYRNGMGGMDMCDCCTALYCANCLCGGRGC